MICRSYTVTAGDAIEDLLPVAGDCHVRIDGPNGFMRELRCPGKGAFRAEVRTDGRNLSLTLTNSSGEKIEVTLVDESYGERFDPIALQAGQSQTIAVSTAAGKQWYDLSASAKETRYRFAGRIETGEWSVSDPAMG
jgi:phospholipase C